MSNQNNIDELIPQSEIDKAKELGKGLSDLKSIVVELVKESNKLRIGSFDGKTLNDTVSAQKKATEAMNELGLSTRVYNNLKKIENELTQVGKDSIEEATLLVRKLTIERNALNLKTQEGAVKQKELNKQIDELNKFIMKNKDSLAQQRMNIGNYASAFEGLRFNVTQVVRELPSLNNGFNVFASAISNNLPMVAADIGRLVQINKELIAQGKPTQSAFTAIASSIFSWQTALIVGLTMLPQLTDAITKSGEEAEKAASKLDKYTEAIRKDIEETLAWGDAITNSNDDGSKAQQRYIDILKAKGESESLIYRETRKLRDLELADIRSEIKTWNDRQEAGVSFQKEILALKEKEKDVLNKIQVEELAYQKKIDDKKREEHKKYLEKKKEDDEFYAQFYNKDGTLKIRQNSEKDVIDAANAAIDSVPTFELRDNPIIKTDKAIAAERIRIAKEVADAKKKFEQDAVISILALADVLTAGESKNVDKREKEAEKSKEQQLAYIESLNVSEQQRRDMKFAAEKQAFTNEQQIQKERESIEKKKFALSQAQALADVLFTTQKSAAAIQAEAAVLAATPATAALAPAALAQLTYVYASAALSAGLIGARVLSYGDGTPEGGHKGGPAEVAERGIPEFYRANKNSPWQLITEHTLFQNMPIGAEVVPIDKASNDMITPKAISKLSSIGGLNLNPLIKGMRDVKQAVENIPVSQINIGKGAIYEAVIKGNSRSRRLSRNILD